MEQAKAQFIEFSSLSKEELLPILARYMNAVVLLKQERRAARTANKELEEVLQAMTKQDGHFRQVIVPDLQMTINKLMEEKADVQDELQALKEELIADSAAGSKRPRGGGRTYKHKYL
jgi:hypothetical protein